MSLIHLARRAALIGALTAAALGLAACFGAAPPVPKEQYFRLIATTEPAAVTAPVTGVVEIPPLQAEGVMGERPLLFTKDNGLKLEQRNYAYWTDPPPAMLRDQLIAYLRAAKLASNVVPSELRVDAQYRVEGRIKRLEQLSGSKNGAAIALDLALIDKATDAIVASGSYEVTKDASGADIDDAVHALNEGLNQIFAEFAADLAKKG